MAISTLLDLKAAIADFLNRDDLASVIPTFVSLVEADLNRSVRHWRMENRATAPVSTQYSAIPSDFLEPIRLHLETTDYRLLTPTSSQDLQLRRSAGRDVAARPEYYALTQGEIELYPTPDDTYDLEMNYYARIPALVNDPDTNWVLTYFPDAYLYGSLLQSAPYLGEDARSQVWATLYQRAISGMTTENEQMKFGGSGRRMTIRAYS